MIIKSVSTAAGEEESTTKGEAEVADLVGPRGFNKKRELLLTYKVCLEVLD
jgi:hypothetical protein